MDVPTPHQGTGPTLPLRVAVVGTGNIARLHAVALKAEPERAEIVSAGDVSAQALDTFRAGFAVPTGDTEAEEMLRKERPDRVHVCTPRACTGLRSRPASGPVRRCWWKNHPRSAWPRPRRWPPQREANRGLGWPPSSSTASAPAPFGSPT